MLAMEDRQQLANTLGKLLKALEPYEEEILRDTPRNLQEVIRNEPALSPITSSGLEHVRTITDRIAWVIYYLNDPTFPKRHLDQKSASVSPTPEPNTLAAEVDTKIDFGPFDPRNRK